MFKNRPCDACRKRKSRCVINDGAIKCVLCEFRSHDCTFVEDIPPRKRKSVYEEDVVSPRSPNDALRRRLSSDPESSKALSAQVVVEDYADLRGPSLLKKTLGLQRSHHGLYIGSSGRVEPSLRNGGVSSEGSTKSPSGVSFRQVNNNELFTLHSDSTTHLHSDEIADLDAIESLVSPHGKELISLYFRIVHPSFPILHKNVFLEKYARTYREFSPVLLAAVYILAISYWNYSPELSNSPVPDVSALENLAFKSLTYATHRPKLSTVEAGLLLLQRPSGTLWSSTAQMVAVGQDIGLHRDCSTWDIPEWEKGLRKRLAWALFMQDKWGSLVQGRPSHIFKSDWAVRPLIEQDFPENFADENDEEGSTEVEKGRILFTHMVTLTQILSDILTSLYSGEAEGHFRDANAERTKTVLMTAKPLQMRLKDWFSELPDCLNIEHVKLRKLSSSGYLHLAYWATELTLHRLIIRTLPTCPRDSEFLSICQNAATARSKSAIDFVKTLRPEHWQSFWYFASEFSFGLIGVFEVLLSTTFAVEEDVRSSVARQNEYQWTLRMSQKTAGFLDKSIATIDLAAKQAKSRATHHGAEIEGQSAFREMMVLEPENADDMYIMSNVASHDDDPLHSFPDSGQTPVHSHQNFDDDFFFDTGLQPWRLMT